MKKLLAGFLTLLLALLPALGLLSAPRSAFAVFGETNNSPYSCPIGISSCAQSSGSSGVGSTQGTIPQIPAGTSSGDLSDALGGFDLGSLSSFTGGASGSEGGQSSVDQRCPSSQSNGGSLGNRIFDVIANQAGIDPSLVSVLGGMAGSNGQIDTGAILNAAFGNSSIGGVSGSSILSMFSGGQGGSGINTGSFNLGSLFGGSGSGSGGFNLGGLFSGSGSGSGGFDLGGLLGGSSGGSGGVGGIVSGITGGSGVGSIVSGLTSGSGLGGIMGGNVPVLDDAVKSAQEEGNDLQDQGNKRQEEGNANTTVIKQETTELRIKECDTDVAIALAARQIAAESSASTIETIVEGPTRPVQSFAELDRTSYNAGRISYIDNYSGPHRDAVVRYLETQMAAEEGGASAPVDCGEREGGLFQILQQGFFRYSGCSERGSKDRAKDEATRAGIVARGAARDALQPVTYRPQVEPCVVGGVTYDDLDHCPTSKILTPASDVQALAQEAQKEGRELDRNADEPGELGEGADTALRNLTQTILGGFGGLLEGLTGRDRGASQSGSYVDRLRGEAENVALDAGSGSIKGNLTGAIVLEGAFQALLQPMVLALEENAKKFSDLHACFATLAQQPPTLATPIAQAALNASTTATALTASANEKKNQIADSRDVVTQLSELLSRLENEGGVEVTQEAEQTFRLLSDTGFIHTSAQYNALAIETRASLTALSTSLSDATAQLATCEAYP